MAVDLTRIGQLHLGLLAATAGVGYATHWVEPGSVMLGGAVMGANFWLLRRMTDLLRPPAPGAAQYRRVVVAVGAFVLKLGLFLGLLGVLFWQLPVEGLSFALGVTLLLLACVIEAARSELHGAKGVG